MCPICLDTFVWRESQVYLPDAGYAEVDLSRVTVPRDHDDLSRRAAIKCPNRGSLYYPELGDHFLPLRLVTHEPLLLGFVGGSRSGKSHLLAAMVKEIEAGRLRNFDIRLSPLDRPQHSKYLAETVRPLLDDRALPGTPEGRTRFVVAYVIDGEALIGPPRALVFFDVAGADLTADGADARFVTRADGLFYLVDPGRALGAVGPGEAAGDPLDRLRDSAIHNVLDRIQVDGRYSPTPAAIVLVKADRYRFQPPVDTWLARSTRAPLPWASVIAESRDIYALLHSRAQAWLRPAQIHRACTLHVASATGCDTTEVTLAETAAGGPAVEDRFVRPVRTSRVLEPLLAMLVMTGVIRQVNTGAG